MSSSTTADGHIPARTDPAAKKRFKDVLGKSLSTVHGNAVWNLIPSGVGFGAVTNPPVLPLRLSAGGRIYLRSSIEGECVDDARHPGERKVTTHRYAHTVGAVDDLSTQLFSWEWVSTEPTYPHLHLRRSDPTFAGLGKKHIPTGRVFFEDVLRFLIAEEGVVPTRDDWDDVLKETLGRVTAHATWGGRSPWDA